MNCYQAKAGELSKQWYVIDASDVVVGRLAAQIAPILMGKHRPTYTPHIDTGDYVIVTNVEKVVFTGNKWQQKSYQRYSGHPGGQKNEQAWKLLERRPHRILELAVQRMMPKNKIGRQMMGKLKLVVGPEHDHQAQRPIPLEAISGRPAASGILLKPKSGSAAAAPRPALDLTTSRIPIEVSLSERVERSEVAVVMLAEFVELSHRRGSRLPEALKIIVEPDGTDRLVTAIELTLPPSARLVTESSTPIARIESRKTAGGWTQRPESGRVLDDEPRRAEPRIGAPALSGRRGAGRGKQTRPTKRPIVWIDGRGSGSGGFTLGQMSILNIQMGDPARRDIVRSHSVDIPDHDIPDEGLFTEWLVSSATVRLSQADDPRVRVEQVAEHAWVARFKMLIPKEGESEIRRLGVSPLVMSTSSLGVVLIALAKEEEAAPSEIYRHFTIDLPLAGAPAPPPAPSAEVENPKRPPQNREHAHAGVGCPG